MSKLKTNIQIRKDNELARAQAYDNALSRAKKAARAADIGHRKRKDIDVLLHYLTLPARKYQIRPAETFRTKSYNLGRQVVGLIDHLFGRYPAPQFLYQPALNEQGLNLVFGWGYAEYSGRDRALHKEWLVTVVRGESLAKALKGILTKKEVHWFLQAPAENTIKENLFWARCAAAGIPGYTCQFLVQHLWSPENEAMMGDRVDDILRFYAVYDAQLRGHEMRNMTDFIRAVIANRRFSFKGRTYGSMVKLCQEWHRLSYVGVIQQRETWKPLMGSPWQAVVRGFTIRVIELTDNRSLAEEGRKQRHCVFLYTASCISGRTRIMSMRTYVGSREEYRLTIEVNLSEREIVQVRGFANRKPTDDELKILRRWAGDHGLTIVDV